jgi:hypothetical protein
MAEVGFGSVGTSAIVTADGVVGTSGADLVIWNVTVKGGSATTLADITEGTDGTGTARVDIIAPVNDTVTATYPKGLYMIGGAHVDITTTGGSVTVNYSQA